MLEMAAVRSLGSEREVFIGIDPGLSGALAVLTADDVVLVGDFPVIEAASERTRHDKRDPTAKPKRVTGIKRMLDEGSLVNAVELIDDWTKVKSVAIERVGPMPRDGAISAFNFGFTTGLLNGILAARHWPRLAVAPAVWKRELQIPADKSAARLAAIRRWPAAAPSLTLKKHDGRAEAIWLAHYARRNYR